MLLEKLTVGEAISLINNSILDFQDGLSQETITKIIFSINNEIQIRDYLLGIPDTYSMPTCKAFLEYLANSVDGAERYSLFTILSAYYYETEEIEKAIFALAVALDTKSDYSLAKLVERVIQANWPSQAFKSMREELHPRVIDKLNSMQDDLILVA